MNFRSQSPICLGMIISAAVGYFSLFALQTLENPIEKAKIVQIVFMALSAIMFVVFRSSKKNSNRSNDLAETSVHWSSLASARRPMHVETNTDEIQQMIEDFGIKAREANELIFHHRLESQVENPKYKIPHSSDRR